MKNLVRPLSLLATAVLLYGALPAAASLAPDPKLSSPEHVRAELRSYFKNIGQNSPTVLGGLAQSPESLKAIDERIAKMSDEELARFQKMMAESPDWKIAPEAIAKAFPPEMLEQIRKVSADYASRLPKGETMREDVQTLVRMLQLAPDAKLKEMGIDRKMLATMEATFAEMTPLQAAMLQRQAAEKTTWRENSALALQALPPAFQHGSAALAKHGPLTETDVKELHDFRGRLVSVLRRIDALPLEERQMLKAESLSGKILEIAKATPETLFMLRENISERQLRALESNVGFVERIANFTDEEKKDLEKFRSDFSKALKPLGESGGKSFDDALAGLSPAELYVAKKKLDSMGQWQTVLPAFYQAVASPEAMARVKALQGATPDSQAARDLEAFRQQALVYIDSAAVVPGVEAQLVSRARQGIQKAPLDRLELMRLTAERMPPTASASAMLTIGAMNSDYEIGDCSFTITPEICFPEICVDPCLGIDGGCEVCTPAGCTPAVVANLNFICNPIEDALKAVKDAGVSLGNTLVSSMNSAINTAISGVQTTINNLIAGVNNIIDDTIHTITGVINDIYAFVQTIPDKAWSVIKLALDALLDINIKNGVTLRNLIGQGVEVALNSMKTLIGLSGDWWTAISNFTLPAIPCPPSGFHTPFGDVGTRAASTNYARYAVLINGIVDMIPDTELALTYKIPAQILYAAFQFLGVCLDQAAAQTADDLAQSRHDIVIGDFTALQTFIGTQFNTLATNSNNQTTALTTAINNLSTNVQLAVNTQSTNIKTKMTNETTNITTLVNNRDDALELLVKNLGGQTRTNLDSFKTQWLRLFMEMSLAADGDNSMLGTFELRAPIGDLSMIKDVVRSTIDNMILAGETIGNSQKMYDSAVQLMNNGQDKDAYRQFVKAYQEATK